MNVKESEGIACNEGSSGAGGTSVLASDVPTDYQLAPRSNATNNPPLSSTPQLVPQAQQPSHYSLSAPPGFMMRRKRGRPRKYVLGSGTLGPFPISSSMVQERATAVSQTVMNQCKIKYEPVQLGEKISYSVGHNFTPHIITVHAGEDIMKKVISFSQEGSRAICILSATGSVSTVTLRQPDSSGGTLTYQGCFEIMSLSGTFIPCEGEGGIRNTSGGMSISLANSDSQVVGGGVAGLLVAATTIQMMVASFLLGAREPQNPSNSNKNQTETTSYKPF